MAPGSGGRGGRGACGERLKCLGAGQEVRCRIVFDMYEVETRAGSLAGLVTACRLLHSASNRDVLTAKDLATRGEKLDVNKGGMKVD